MRILNFGSLNLDLFYTVDHFVQAGETLSSEKLERFCGGKGLNQSIALARAGAPVWHAGCIGEDGRCLLELLAENGVNVTYVRTSGQTSGHAVIQRDRNGQNCILLYGGANSQLTDAFVDEVLAGFGKGDVLLLQNEINQLDRIVDRAWERGMKIVLNPSPANEALDRLDLSKIDTFLLNEIEGQALTGRAAPDEILDELRRRYPAATIVLTLGKAGVCYDDGTLRCSHGIYDVPVADTTGAGDTFTGYYLAASTAGETPQEALRLASVASSLAVTKIGAAPSIPTMREVRAADLKLK